MSILAGVKCHIAVDRFTDAHPLVQQSQARIQPPFHRFAAVLVDVFYDHFLARDWHCYATTPFRLWVDEVYAQFLSYEGGLHTALREGLCRMVREDWLGQYHSLEGIAAILQRMARRLSRPTLLGQAASQLEAHYDALRADFHAYFPQLQQFVTDWRAEHE
ncbi:MAG: ACP phosphodiesterase [Thermoflexales bacterium]